MTVSNRKPTASSEAPPDCIYSRCGCCQKVETLTLEIEHWKSEQRRAFMAGRESVYNFDAEQAWQQYRCQDPADFQAVPTKDRRATDSEAIAAGWQIEVHHTGTPHQTTVWRSPANSVQGVPPLLSELEKDPGDCESTWHTGEFSAVSCPACRGTWKT